MTDPRERQFAAERDAAISIAHKAMQSSYIGPPPKLRGDAERMVDALISAGWGPMRVDPNYLRWCAWPGCLRSFNVLAEPGEADRQLWIYVRDGGCVLLCPDHRDLGHRPQHFEWERGNDTISTSCECGARGEDLRPTTMDRCHQWWRGHINSLDRTAPPADPKDSGG